MSTAALIQQLRAALCTAHALLFGSRPHGQADIDMLRAASRQGITAADQWIADQPAQKPVAPDGWKLVPAEPTPQMLDAAARASMQHLIDCINDPAMADQVGSEEMCRLTYGSRYKSMLAASPPPPVGRTDTESHATPALESVLQLIEDYAKAVHDGNAAECVVLHRTVRASVEQLCCPRRASNELSLDDLAECGLLSELDSPRCQAAHVCDCQEAGQPCAVKASLGRDSG